MGTKNETFEERDLGEHLKQGLYFFSSYGITILEFFLWEVIFMDGLICGQCGSEMFRVEDGWMCEKCGDYVSDISIMDEEEYEENYSE